MSEKGVVSRLSWTGNSAIAGPLSVRDGACGTLAIRTRWPHRRICCVGALGPITMLLCSSCVIKRIAALFSLGRALGLNLLEHTHFALIARRLST